MASDDRVVSFASGGIILTGLTCVAAARCLFPRRYSLAEISRLNPVPWAPRGWRGAGEGGSSPIFGFMWGIVYFLCFLTGVCVIAASAMGSDASDAASLFNACACAAGGLQLAAVWSPLFQLQKTWSFAMASVVLVVAAVVTSAGAAVSSAFFVDTWYEQLAGVTVTFFAGWVVVAAGLSVGITTRVYGRGLNSKSSKTSVASSYFPLVLAIILCALAVLCGNPIFPVPLLCIFFFLPGVFSDWKLWVAGLVALAGVAAGTVMIFVYRAAGYLFSRQ